MISNICYNMSVTPVYKVAIEVYWGIQIGKEYGRNPSE